MQLRNSEGKRMYGAWSRGWKVSRQLLLAAVIGLGMLSIYAVTQIELTTQVKGILPVGNGGTGVNAPTAHGVMVGEGGSATTSAGPGAADTVLMGNGIAADPSFVSVGSCSAAGNALTYNTSSHAFGCNTGFGTIPTFVDNETPTGSVGGGNDTFTLAHAPSPAASLNLYKNGQLMIAGGADYTLTTNSIVYVAGSIPIAGDVHRASYRY